MSLVLVWVHWLYINQQWHACITRGLGWVTVKTLEIGRASYISWGQTSLSSVMTSHYYCTTWSMFYYCTTWSKFNCTTELTWSCRLGQAICQNKMYSVVLDSVLECHSSQLYSIILLNVKFLCAASEYSVCPVRSKESSVYYRSQS